MIAVSCLHVDFHIWVIRFIIWPVVPSACDYVVAAEGAGPYVTKEHRGRLSLLEE